MIVFLLVVAAAAAIVATIGLFFEKGKWMAVLALGIAAYFLAALWPHLGIQ